MASSPGPPNQPNNFCVPCAARLILRSAAEGVDRYPYATFRPLSADDADPFLTRLLAPKSTEFEFAFGLEPVVQMTAWLFAAFKIYLVCATSDFLVAPSSRPEPLRSRPGLLRLLCFHFALVSTTWSSPSSLCAFSVTPQAVHFERLRPW